MSYYATIDDDDSGNDEGTGGDVATLTGWIEFREWVDGHKEKRPEMLQVAHYGLSERLQDLADEIASAIKSESPSDDVKDIADGLLLMIKKTKDPKAVLTISN